jgi:hypothetical protein
MSDAPRGRRTVLLIAAVAGAAAAVFVAIATGAAQRSGMPAAVPIGLLVFTALLVFVVVLATREAKRKAMEKWSASLSAAGLGEVDLSAADARDAAFAPFAHLSALRHGAKKLKFAGEGRIDGRPVVLARHQFVISTGKSSQTITHTLAATPVPAGWPDLTIEPEHLGHKIAAAFGKKDMRVADDAFDRAWHVKPGGPGGADFALLLLGPETQAFLMSLPRRDRGAWTIGRGWLVHAVRRQVKPSEIAVNCGQLAGLLATVPAELDAWDPGVVS